MVPLTVNRQLSANLHGTLTYSSPSFLNSDEPAPVAMVYPTTPVNLNVEQSASLTLECVLSGDPSSAAVKWSHNGREVSPGSRRRRLLHRNLVLSDVTPGDSGTYRCSLQTDTDTVASANYTVNVLGELMCVPALPFIYCTALWSVYSVFKCAM